jgi:hypothetical protein
MSDAAESDKTSLILTGLTTIGAATAVIWGQQQPGFSWDKAATAWLRDHVPGLKVINEVVAWPLLHRWSFATTVVLAVILLSALKKRKAAAFLLSSVSGGLLSEWALEGLKVPLAPVMQTLFYGTLFGGLAMGLHPGASSEQRSIWWTLAGLVMLASALATVGSGAALPLSAWGVSVLLVASWLLLLDQLMR